MDNIKNEILLSNEVAWTRKMIDKFMICPIPERDALIARYLLFIAPEVDKKIAKHFNDKNANFIDLLKFLENEENDRRD